MRDDKPWWAPGLGVPAFAPVSTARLVGGSSRGPRGRSAVPRYSDSDGFRVRSVPGDGVEREVEELLPRHDLSGTAIGPPPQTDPPKPPELIGIYGSPISH